MPYIVEHLNSIQTAILHMRDPAPSFDVVYRLGVVVQLDISLQKFLEDDPLGPIVEGIVIEDAERVILHE
jgi:hypothetical protein